MQRRRSVQSQLLAMKARTVSFVDIEPVDRKTRSKTYHKPIAPYFCNDGRRRNNGNSLVAADYGAMGNVGRECEASVQPYERLRGGPEPARQATRGAIRGASDVDAINQG